MSSHIAYAHNLTNITDPNKTNPQVLRDNITISEHQTHSETERLAHIGRMLTSVAHDLRNPMAVISGYAHLMAHSNVETERRHCYARILHEVEEINAMITDLLAFARGDSYLHPAAVALIELQKEIEDKLSIQAQPRGIILTVKIAKPGTIVVDLGRVKRIVSNLSRNAMEALERGGRVDIDFSIDNGSLLFNVSDNGPGLSETLMQLFQEPSTNKTDTHNSCSISQNVIPALTETNNDIKNHSDINLNFNTSNVTAGFYNSFKNVGTGLGLSIVKRFVADHSGSIKVTSKKGRGTTFSIRLPSLAAAHKVGSM
ncbi:MAG: HAMP domain-containing histidine kinase [Deltaproteobacteria bacterium]|nr:HAMP domain-containing histidine kinase [Deltaproteobacteria bacterium]